MPKVGERKYVDKKISNAVLGLPLGVTSAIGNLGSATIKKVAREVAEEIGKKVGSKFVPGLNVVSSIATLISLVNGACGNDGFLVTVELEYTEVYLHKEGYSVSGWNIRDLEVEVY